MVFHKNIYIVSVVLVSIFLVKMFNNVKLKHPYAGLNTKQLVEKFEYPIEIHEVTTEDGYILTLHRIPHGLDEPKQERTPILFMHGFMQSSNDFVCLGPGKALSFLLADRGYDIWLGNARGTTWSRRHKNLDPDRDDKFWDFSVDEIAMYDVPAFIDHILNVTGETQIQYVGYSQGASTYFMLLSEKPEYNNKITFMTALAPAVFMKDPYSPVLKLVLWLRKIVEFIVSDILNIQEIAPNGGLISIYLKQICDENSVFEKLCIHHLSLLHGYHTGSINKFLFPVIFSNMPAGVSAKQMFHIFQAMDSGKFQQYDLGVTGNLKKYGQEEPPIYNLSKVSTPIALYYSSNDWTVDIKNMDKLLGAIPNVVKNYQVPVEKFNHNDFVYGSEADRFLYNQVLEEILKY